MNYRHFTFADLDAGQIHNSSDQDSIGSLAKMEQNSWFWLMTQ